MRFAARDSPLLFGISLSFVGGPANAPRNSFCKRPLVSAAPYFSESFVMALSRTKAIEELQAAAKKIPDQGTIISRVHDFEIAARRGLDADSTISLVLTATGLLEYALAEAIASRLSISNHTIKRKIFDGDHEREGVIGTIYTRNLLAHALNIYGEKTFNDVNTVRIVRNLCAHAKSDLDFSSEALKTICQFTITKGLLEAFGYADKHVPDAVSPIHAMSEFIQHLVPYLLLHTSKDWPEQNRLEWRVMFS